MKKTTLHTMILIGIAALFTGCAVLTIDVDVYKGPLANHEDIQMEQMAAMAIGAKPLLIELRDRLEANYMRTVKKVNRRDPKYRPPETKFEAQLEWYGKYGRKDFETRLRVLRSQPWYETTFVKKYRNERGALKSHFLGSNADHVNNILWLYEDVSKETGEFGAVLVELHKEIDSIIARYVESYSLLRPHDMAEDEDLAKEVQNVEKKLKERTLKDPNALKLLSAYKDYLNSDERDALKVVRVASAYLETAEPNSPLLIEMKNRGKSEADILERVTNAAQSILGETNFVNVCADEIFGLRGELRDQFVGRVKEIARAYLDSRTALEDLWLATMNGIIRVNSQTLDPNEFADRDKATAQITDLSLELIQPRYLAVLLDVESEKHFSDDINDLAHSLGPYPLADPKKPNNRWDFEQMKKILSEGFAKDPAGMAVILKAIHKFCESKLDPEKSSIKQYVGKGDLGSLGYKEGWRFGLVRAPFGAISQAKPSQTLFQHVFGAIPWIRSSPPESRLRGGRHAEAQSSQLKSLSPESLPRFALGGAYSGGRREKGLETLIENYLKLSDKTCLNESQEPNLCAARETLSDDLVGFAEKLLFVANNRSLMSPPKGDVGLLPGTFIGFYRLILGQTFVDRMRDMGLITLLPEETDQYTRILQAVGNSILVQADALHQERKHREQLDNHYEKEEAVLRATLDRISSADQNSMDVSAIKSALSKHSTAKDSKCYTAKDIRDVWITLLEYEHDLALRNGDKKRADQVLKAINAARKKREGMIFIRPATAYLRTSFPATSLQGNPNLTWDNMLGEHMMRSIPFAPQIGEFLDPDAKRDARITAEIDKQFWQNINRVRVAGGGFMNYAVVKDDIGNWYVKGYSADPKDVIQSAQNLAKFAAAGQVSVPSLISSSPSDESNQTRGTPGSALESILNKCEEDYRKKTQKGYDLLCEFMHDPNTNVRYQIKELWKANEEVHKKQTELETALDWSYKQFLETFDPNDRKCGGDTGKQHEQIIEGIKRLKQFRNDLIWKITNVYRQDGASTNSSSPGKVAAKSIVRNVVDGRINDLLANRKDAIRMYENALTVLAEGIQQKE